MEKEEKSLILRDSPEITNEPIKVLSGTIQKVNVDEDEFEAARRAFHGSSKGKEVKKRRKSDDGGRDPSNIDRYKGSWGKRRDVNNTNDDESIVSKPSEEEMARYLNEKAAIVPATLLEVIPLGQERSIFHGKSELDIFGHSYMHPPSELIGMNSPSCKAPKKLIHTYSEHTKGVNCIRFIPKTGHLLLSAGQDQRIKLWNVMGDRECLRTFYGHNKPVKQVEFDGSGSHFVSCSYDRSFKIWDTEKGKCTFYKEHRTAPYCATFHPNNDNTLFVGTADRKVLQLDLRSGEIVKEYAQHSGAVNSITFFNNNQNFVTSSDDKSLRIWEVGNTKSVKRIGGVGMSNMPCAALHPSEPYILFQSITTNQIMTYVQQDYLLPRDKQIGGHVTGGYPCQVGFSPDGKFIYSGDSRGKLVIWHWKGGEIVRRLDAHSQVCIDAQWHPLLPSLMATCSWDGTVKLWS